MFYVFCCKKNGSQKRINPFPFPGFSMFQACVEGLTRLDRVMVLPLDVRDDFILPDAALEARNMLKRPINMVFNCAGFSTTEGRDMAGGPSSDNNSVGVDLAVGPFFYLFFLLDFLLFCAYRCVFVCSSEDMARIGRGMLYTVCASGHLFCGSSEQDISSALIHTFWRRFRRRLGLARLPSRKYCSCMVGRSVGRL